MQTIRNWWHGVGCKRYPGARHLTITADGGGSNGSRMRLWKRELQKLSNELGLEIRVHHLPPGKTGLTVQCELDTSSYPKGIVVTDQEMSEINILRDDFHGEWNYTLHPCNKTGRAVNS